MPSLNMKGPFPLTTDNVNLHVDDKIGNYAFGKPEDGKWYVKYVGRSDSQLREEIKQQAKNHKMLDIEGYEYKFRYADSGTEAYEQECLDYHKYRDNGCLQNKIHPAKPTDNNHYHCPVEGCPEHEDK